MSSLDPVARGLAVGAGNLARTGLATANLRPLDNLFDPNDKANAYGQYLLVNGTQLGSSQYNVTHPIRVEPGKPYTRMFLPLNPALANSVPSGVVHYQDQSGAFLSADAGAAFTFTPPTGAYSMRMMVPTQFWYSFQVIQSASVGTSYFAPDNKDVRERESHFQIATMRQTRMRAGNLLLGLVPTQQLVVNMIGDSYFDAPERSMTAFANYLVSKLGDAGGGYTGSAFKTALSPPYARGGSQPATVNGNARPLLYPVIYSGNVVSESNANYFQNPTPSLGVAVLSATGDAIDYDFPAAPAISGIDFFYAGTGAASVLLYGYAATQGGTPSSWTTLNLPSIAVGVGGVATLSISGIAQPGTLRVEWVSGVSKVGGPHFKSTAGGVRVNKMAASGGAFSQWLAQDISPSLIAMGAHLTILEDGRNSQAAGVNQSTWDGQLRGMVNKVRGQVGGTFGTMATDVLVYTPFENNVGGAVAVAAYSQVARRRAYIMRYAHIDGQVSFGYQGQVGEYLSTGDVPLLEGDGVHQAQFKGGTLVSLDLINAVLPLRA